jgi:hypothetical protein
VLWSPSLTTSWVSQGRATAHPTGRWFFCCRLRSMFPLAGDNTIWPWGCPDLSINIPSCATSRFLRTILTCRLTNMYRYFEGPTWLRLQGQAIPSSGASRTIFRAKHDYLSGQVGPSLRPSRTIVRAKHTNGQSQERSLPGSSRPRIVMLDCKYESSAFFRNVGKDKPADMEYYS